MSNLPSTLAELISPLPEAEFLQLLHERKLTLLRGRDGKPLYGTPGLVRAGADD